jgi:hypothetical protein
LRVMVCGPRARMRAAGGTSSTSDRLAGTGAGGAVAADVERMLVLASARDESVKKDVSVVAFVVVVMVLCWAKPPSSPGPSSPS